MSAVPLPRRSHLGLTLSRATRPPLAVGPRLWVESIDAGSPAEQAGVAVGDAVLAIGGTETNDLAEVRAIVARLPIAQATRLELQRGEQRVELELCARPLPLEPLGVGEVVLDEVPWRDHRLRAVWSFPERAGPVPAIWLLPGAAWLSEEHPIEPESARLELVRALSRAGFATLRVERSGLGDSEGPACTELDLHAELEAWRAASRYFREHPRVQRDARCVYARSLGGMLAPLLAAEHAFSALAVWGTSAEPWPSCMLRAAERQYRLAGRSGTALEQTLAQLAELRADLRCGLDAGGGVRAPPRAAQHGSGGVSGPPRVRTRRGLLPALGCAGDDGTQPRDPGRDVVAAGGSSAGSAGSAQGGSSSSGPAGSGDGLFPATAGAGGAIALDDSDPGADAGGDAGDTYAPVPIYGGVFPDPLTRARV